MSHVYPMISISTAWRFPMAYYAPPATHIVNNKLKIFSFFKKIIIITIIIINTTPSLPKKMISLNY